MILGAQRGGERVEARVERLDTAGVQSLQTCFAVDDAERGAALRARFGQPQPSVVELEGDEDVAAAEFWRGELSNAAGPRS